MADKVVDNNNNDVIIANDVANIDAYVTAAVAMSQANGAVCATMPLVMTTDIAVSVTPSWHSVRDVRRTNQNADGGNHQAHDQLSRHHFTL